MKEVELVVIGGGAAGMAAAVSAYKNGVRDILILERNSALGGVLQQCIHNGFGLHRFKEDLTGVEFAARYADMVQKLGIPYLLNTFVIELHPDRTITAVSPEEGLMEIRAKAVVLAMGCRERSRNALLIPGARGAGIMTAGTAQRYLNIDGYLPGRRIVIVGSGDIGLIMARQFVLEGCEVAAVVEIMPYSGGLPRNMKQCIEDFDIPVYYNSVISEIRGKERVSSVLVGKVDESRRLIPGTEFEISCDTLLISAGLIPENELTESAGIAMSRATKGALVTEDLQTSIPGIFSCGNVLHVHDLVDFVSEEGEEAGRNAAAWLLAQKETASKEIVSKEAVSKENALAETASKEAASMETASKEETTDGNIRVLSGDGVGGIVPQTVRQDTPLPEVHFMFRPRARYRGHSPPRGPFHVPPPRPIPRRGDHRPVPRYRERLRSRGKRRCAYSKYRWTDRSEQHEHLRSRGKQHCRCRRPDRTGQQDSDPKALPRPHPRRNVQDHYPGGKTQKCPGDYF